jgi:hypothetical protein
MTTIREQVKEAMQREIKPALIAEHERNYRTLYVRRDGRLHWYFSATDNEWLVDAKSDSDSIQAVWHLIQVGTGSCGCDCDNCHGPDKFDDPSDIEFESDAYDAMGARLQEALDELAPGYFNDEQ